MSALTKLANRQPVVSSKHSTSMCLNGLYIDGDARFPCTEGYTSVPPLTTPRCIDLPRLWSRGLFTAEDACLGSLEGGCDPGFPGSQLFSSNPDFVCGKPLHAVRGKGSHFSVGQELNLLGNFRILPSHCSMLGVPVGVSIGPALRRSVSSHPTTFAAYVSTCPSGDAMAISCRGVFLTACWGWWISGSLVLGARWLGR
jgi:hypothetical protein